MDAETERTNSGSLLEVQDFPIGWSDEVSKGQNREWILAAKTWTQPKCPSTDDWIKKMWCRNFSEGPVVRTPHFHCRGAGFDPWSGN